MTSTSVINKPLVFLYETVNEHDMASGIAI